METNKTIPNTVSPDRTLVVSELFCAPTPETNKTMPNTVSPSDYDDEGRRLGLFTISSKFLLGLFGTGVFRRGWYVSSDPLPEDARITSLQLNIYGNIEMIVESKAFPLVKDGDEIPRLPGTALTSFACAFPDFDNLRRELDPENVIPTLQ